VAAEATPRPVLADPRMHARADAARFPARLAVRATARPGIAASGCRARAPGRPGAGITRNARTGYPGMPSATPGTTTTGTGPPSSCCGSVAGPSHAASRARARAHAKNLCTTFGCAQQRRQHQPDSTKPGEVHARLPAGASPLARRAAAWLGERHRDRLDLVMLGVRAQTTGLRPPAAHRAPGASVWRSRANSRGRARPR
jgi:hypothetical protein